MRGKRRRSAAKAGLLTMFEEKDRTEGTRAWWMFARDAHKRDGHMAAPLPFQGLFSVFCDAVTLTSSVVKNVPEGESN